FKLIGISGVKFRDTNGDGVRQGTDPALNGWVIYLDTNDNNQLDGNEPRVTTPATGAYSFTDLGPGTYHVREVLRTGWTQPPRAPAVVAVSGQDVVADFGNFQNYDLAGQVFHDRNGNGIKDPLGAGVAELGLGGRLVFLDANGNNQLDSGELRATTTPG